MQSLPQFRGRNRLLAKLHPPNLQLLAPHFQPVRLKKDQTLYAVHDKVNHAYFPQAGLIGILRSSERGQEIETTTIGTDGVLGALAALGPYMATSRSVVLIEGNAIRVSVTQLQAAAKSSLQIRNLIALWNEHLLLAVQQICLCNTFHKIEARICRWILDSARRIEINSVAISQETLARQLGVHRGTLNAALARLHKEGVLEVRARSHISILDMPRLEAASCECHSTIEAHAARILERAGE